MMTDGYPYASQYRDRHGKTRWRFRKGKLTVGLRGEPGSPEFDAAYQAAAAGSPIRHGLPRAKLSPRGVIYAIQGASGAPVKIGFAVEGALSKRIAVLQTGNHDTLRVVGLTAGYQRHERLAHAALATERVSGEWFAWSDRTRAFIEAMASGIDVALDTIGRPHSSRLGCSWRTLSNPMSNPDAKSLTCNEV